MASLYLSPALELKPRVRFRLVRSRFPRYSFRMSPAYAMLFATGAAGVIAGAGTSTFLAAAVSAAAVTWLLRIPPRAGKACFAVLDPDQPDGDIILKAVKEASAHVRRSQAPVLLRVAAPAPKGRAPFSIGLDRDGDLVLLSDGRRPQALKQPGLWLADHPLPLILPRSRCLTFRLEPAGPERVRASLFPASGWPRRLWPAAAAVAASACLFDAGALLAATLGAAFQAYLVKDNPRCPRDQR